MSRSRNLKPGFFQNDILAECDPLARILFQGLWCEADREGRLEDRPKKIKAACLPYDACDIEVLLGQLQAKGFIVRYEVAGKRYIAVLNFGKHQNPHVKEGASTIPAPDLSGASPGDSGAGPADSLLLIPDSLAVVVQASQADRTIGSPSTDSAPEDGVGAFEGQPPADVARATEKGMVYLNASLRLRAAGCDDVSASDAHLRQALQDGITVEELTDMAVQKPGKGIAYLCKAVRGKRADAAATGGTVAAVAGSTRNTAGPSPRLSPEEEKARAADALAAMERQLGELGYAQH